MKNLMSLIVIVLLLFNSLASNGQNTSMQDSIRPYSNPVLIKGSSFGNFFKALYKTGDFKTMMKFTSKKSIDNFGYDNILNFYQSTDFGYDMKLKSRTFQNGMCTLHYTAQILGTQRVVRLNVVVENDSSKIVLNNILFNLGIDKENVMK